MGLSQYIETINNRYRKALDNLIITDYLCFQFFQNGKQEHEIRIADIYAQTLAYGMFAARLHDDTLDTFSRQEAAELIPKSNPFLRKLFNHVAGADIDDRIKTTVDNLADVFRATDVKALLKNFGRATQTHDPIIHFYETFLAEYDPKLRKARGVWYTPEPVVSFIVRGVDEHLIPRLNGFELLMASYAMAHLKLDMLLRETGFVASKEQRLNIYLTNSLEEHHPDTGTLFSSWLSSEANEANHIKRDTPVMVVMGNPPYSVSSSNKSVWIQELLKDYKKDLNERNIQPLSDDYIKFIRYGQYFIDKNGEGILAYISNNSFIDGVIHRQMRKHLLESFDKVYILDLHGNSKKKETAPDGSKDENQQILGENTGRKPNFNAEIIEGIAKGMGLDFETEKSGDSDKFAPIDLLDYIYAVLHSPSYRETYKEFLKIDFPRIPYPKDAEKFWALVKLGGELRQVHLLESATVENYITSYPKDGDNIVTRKITKTSPGYEPTSDTHGNVWINDEQYFEDVPLIAWEFYIGGYQPAQKWLKDRVGRKLSFDDILHYQKIIVALTETDRIMSDIDAVVPDWVVILGKGTC